MNSEDINLAQLKQMAMVNRKAINRLKERVNHLENALEMVCDDPQMAWLFRNRSERMDASVAMFPEARAMFHLARYHFACNYVQGKAVADIASGTGYGCRTLLEQGQAKSVVGIDICADAIQYAKSKHAVQGAKYIAASATDTNLPDESLDVITSFETIEHLKGESALVAEFARILKPGGILICSTPNQWPLEIAPHHVREYDRASFTKVLQPTFEIQQMYNQNSGSDFRFNREQDAGIIETTEANQELAECYIAVGIKR